MYAEIFTDEIMVSRTCFKLKGEFLDIYLIMKTHVHTQIFIALLGAPG